MNTIKPLNKYKKTIINLISIIISVLPLSKLFFYFIINKLKFDVGKNKLIIKFIYIFYFKSYD